MIEKWHLIEINQLAEFLVLDRLPICIDALEKRFDFGIVIAVILEEPVGNFC